MWDSDELVAWRLTEDGTVDHVFGGRRANSSDSIWGVCGTDNPRFSFEDQTVIIEDSGNIICTYHAETGEILEPIQMLPHSTQYGMVDIMYGEHYHHHHKLDDEEAFSEGSWPVSLQEGWVRDPEGKCQLWMFTKWRRNPISLNWHYNITTLWYGHEETTFIVMF